MVMVMVKVKVMVLMSEQGRRDPKGKNQYGA
jgi:hypothetical protein